MSSKALLVIDIQEDYTGVIPVLLTKLFSHGTAIKGKPGTEFDKRLNIVSENCFTKSMPSAFTNAELKKYLDKNKIEELDVVGLDGKFCVKETVKGAIKEKYSVNLISNAILFKNENKREEVFKSLKELGAKII